MTEQNQRISERIQALECKVRRHQRMVISLVFLLLAVVVGCIYAYKVEIQGETREYEKFMKIALEQLA